MNECEDNITSLPGFSDRFTRTESTKAAKHLLVDKCEQNNESEVALAELASRCVNFAFSAILDTTIQASNRERTRIVVGGFRITLLAGMLYSAINPRTHLSAIATPVGLYVS